MYVVLLDDGYAWTLATILSLDGVNEPYFDGWLQIKNIASNQQNIITTWTNIDHGKNTSTNFYQTPKLPFSSQEG